ncbi:unnamed protein product [marine sediment metagenome]|uniref:Uncharacterized protein n=1 Tax=marine sediment metagenome TaxID=412755 RepID=X1GAP4_9ZZZZ
MEEKYSEENLKHYMKIGLSINKSILENRVVFWLVFVITIFIFCPIVVIEIINRNFYLTEAKGALFCGIVCCFALLKSVKILKEAKNSTKSVLKVLEEILR